MSINLNKYAQALIKYDTVHVCRDGSSMIPGRGGGGALVLTCVGHVCRPPSTTVHSSLIIMLLLKLLYLILSFLLYHKK
jgi:hypothetical protein